MKRIFLISIIGFSLSAKAEKIDFNALISEVEANIAQQTKQVVTIDTKLRQPASTKSETKENTKKADAETTSHQ